MKNPRRLWVMLTLWITAFPPLSFPVQAKENYLTLTVENDLLGAGTDHNYSSGVRLQWFDVGARPPGIGRELGKLFPLLATNENTSTFYSLGQNIFTPRDVESPIQNPTDRPWAGFLYGSVGMVTPVKHHVDELELTLGVIGPLALGEEAQKTVHNAIRSTHPRGWDNQLENEPGLMLSWERRWPHQLAVSLGDAFFTITTHAGATIGNIYTYGNAGGLLILSSKRSRWDDKPLQVRPAIPGTGYFEPSPCMQWELFAGAEGRVMAHNIFLDGSSFAHSHSVDKKPLVADLNAGVAFIWGNTRLSYTATYRSKEFHGQEKASLFGGVSLGYGF